MKREFNASFLLSSRHIVYNIEWNELKGADE